MPQPRRILVFPCGSEIGLEIHRSLRHSTHFDLIGASSVDDHGRFVYERYIGDLPFHDDAAFAGQLARIVREHQIDALYPAMDAVAETLQRLGPALGCRVIGSDARATSVCASKSATYALLAGVVPLPQRYASPGEARYPLFIKPDRGYGSRDCLRADHPAEAEGFLARHRGRDMLMLQFLPGQEWTVDCFSDRHGELRFCAARTRARVSNGISVRTAPSAAFQERFTGWARAIHQALRPRGAWFFQARADPSGAPRLLEVAARLGGSSGLFRCQGVNFAMLSAFDAFDQDVEIAPNTYPIELDRALESRYRLDIAYSHLFVDLDDCLIVRGRLNHQLVALLYQAADAGKGLTLLTRHARDPWQTLGERRLAGLFDRVIHLRAGERKSDYIDRSDAVFIDDSFAERQDVARTKAIPVFAPDMVEALL